MPTVLAHVEVKPELPSIATCVECRRSYRPRNEEQAIMELCDNCYDDVKFPHERVISVHVHARPARQGQK
ncbi:MAG TPA: hypothetical protein VMH48_08610 [Methylomirabilota bacterium]|nr:hypothetical protein [Methylomirabilota bacterium]